MQIKLSKIIGVLLLVPPVVSVLLFAWYIIRNVKSGLTAESVQVIFLGKFQKGGDWNSESFIAGITSTTPIYFGLMAIAGAILIRGATKTIQQNKA
jgi:hypothetical protein